MPFNTIMNLYPLQSDGNHKYNRKQISIGNIVNSFFTTHIKTDLLPDDTRHNLKIHQATLPGAVETQWHSWRGKIEAHIVTTRLLVQSSVFPTFCIFHCLEDAEFEYLVAITTLTLICSLINYSLVFTSTYDNHS